MNPAQHASPPGGTAGWEEYWRRTSEASAHRAGGPQEEVLANLWRGLFDEFFRRAPAGRVLDVACGNGALFHHVPASIGGDAVLVGLDHSPSALHDFQARFPRARAIASDARKTPFGDGAFDMVASQFGVEYAGLAGIGEACRLVAPGGFFAAVLHLENGAIFRENIANLEAMQRLGKCALLPAMRALFEANEALRRGRGSRPALRERAAAVERALAESAALLREKGAQLAGGVVRRLHEDASHMARNADAYDCGEALAWSERNAAEIEAYAGRMSSMLAAAVSEPGMEAIVRHISERGLHVRARDKLAMGARKEAAAWLLLCERP